MSLEENKTNPTFKSVYTDQCLWAQTRCLPQEKHALASSYPLHQPTKFVVLRPAYLALCPPAHLALTSCTWCSLKFHPDSRFPHGILTMFYLPRRNPNSMPQVDGGSAEAPPPEARQHRRVPPSHRRSSTLLSPLPQLLLSSRPRGHALSLYF